MNGLLIPGNIHSKIFFLITCTQISDSLNLRDGVKWYDMRRECFYKKLFIIVYYCLLSLNDENSI
ncbi:hypothetical protein FAD_1486 [Ferroplasma acidiphilum]|uniref:Uncharacterized protein n=1 Tax=Ferroplasma acidiphilum TaxID=74969 RepID=A0A1V0N5G5_9ARCH|nr:hypothetical protein FAD_1486 [Ferroplasma acidiphilum]